MEDATVCRQRRSGSRTAPRRDRRATRWAAYAGPSPVPGSLLPSRGSLIPWRPSRIGKSTRRIHAATSTPLPDGQRGPVAPFLSAGWKRLDDSRSDRMQRPRSALRTGGRPDGLPGPADPDDIPRRYGGGRSGDRDGSGRLHHRPLGGHARDRRGNAPKRQPLRRHAKPDLPHQPRRRSCGQRYWGNLATLLGKLGYCGNSTVSGVAYSASMS